MMIGISEFLPKRNITIEELDAEIERLHIESESLTEWPDPEETYPTVIIEG